MGRGISTLRTLGAATLAAILILACNALSGAGDLDPNEAPDSGPDTSTIPPNMTDSSVVPSTDAQPDTGGPEEDAQTKDVYVEPPKACPAVGRTCTPVAPAGWEGPVFVYEGAAAAPECPANMALTKLDAFGGAPSGSVSCGTCTCGTPTGTACSVTLRDYDADDCTGGATSTRTLSTACIQTSDGVDAFRLSLVASGGSCATNGGAPTKSAITWPSTYRACGAPELLQDGCAAGELCTPDPPTPFRAKTCIVQANTAACPAPWTVPLSVSRSTTDSRGCSACACGAPVGVACSGSVQYFDGQTGCGGSGQTISIASTSCHPANDESGIRLAAAVVAAGGACSVSVQAAPTGAVAAASPASICCLP